MTETTDLGTAQNEIRTRVAGISGGQWDLPTPCTDWSVADLVAHLAEGSRMASQLLRGTPGEAAQGFPSGAHGSDLEAELEVALTDELRAFDEPGALDRVVHHPGAGDISGARLFRFRIAEYLIHSWDLTRATHGDEHLPQGLVATVWQDMKPTAPYIGKIGAFGDGPSGTLAHAAPLQHRLLDLTGRRP